MGLRLQLGGVRPPGRGVVGRAEAAGAPSDTATAIATETVVATARATRRRVRERARSMSASWGGTYRARPVVSAVVVRRLPSASARRIRVTA